MVRKFKNKFSHKTFVKHRIGKVRERVPGVLGSIAPLVTSI